MLIIYRILINIVYLLSPIIIIIRLIKKKEDSKRFKEKFCFFTKKKIKGKLIWIHGASVGEFQSIVPLIEKYEKTNRSYYGGAIGLFGFNGDFNTAIMIRTFLSKNNFLYWQAGAGIVDKSDENNELQDCLLYTSDAADE